MVVRRDRNGGAVAEIFFGVLAGLGGLATLACTWAAYQRYRIEPDPPWALLGVCLIPLLFTVAFGGVCAALAASRRSEEAMAARRALNPAEPWLWEDKWRDGRIEAGRQAPIAAMLIGFAAVWNTVITAVAITLYRRGDLVEKPALWLFILAFGAAGIFLLGLALYQFALARKFGRSLFEMEALPGVIGGRLNGTIQLPPQIPDGIDAGVTLNCDAISTTGNRSNTSRCLWQDGIHARTSADGRIPISFTIPFGFRSSGELSESGDSRIDWSLRVTARVPGVDFQASFDVPVFSTAASDSSISAGSVDTSTAAERPPGAKVSIVEAVGGRTLFAIGKAKGLGCGVSAFVLLPLTAVAIGRTAGLGLESTAVWSVVALVVGTAFLALTVAGVLLTATGVEVGPDEVRVPHGRRPLTWTRTIPLADVAEIKYASSGSTPSQRVEAHTTDGKSYGLAGQLSSVEEAKWFAAEVTRAIERARDATR